MKVKVWTVFTTEVELTDVDITFILLYAEVNKEYFKERNELNNFQRILDDAMMYLHLTSAKYDMDYNEIQDWWFEEHKDIVKTFCF